MRVVCLLALLAGVVHAAETNAPAWTEFKTIMWTGDRAYQQDPSRTALFFRRLKELGINTGMVYDDADPKPLVENKFPYYVENMVNRGLSLKFNSSVTNWEAFVSKWQTNGRPESAFKRDYSLDDPQWKADAKKKVEGIVRKNMANAPILYDLRDELSVTVSANPFDYDYSPQTLAGFRTWLKEQYTNLNALNAEWDTKFSSWEEVKPFSTDEIKNRMAGGKPGDKIDWGALQKLEFDPAKAMDDTKRWNFAPWCDFRTYMDISLARALNDLRAAGKAVDSKALFGIEGTQMPHAFGGYDLWRLSQAIDWVEPYDIGSARAIFSSFMNGKSILTTISETDTDHARRRMWHLLFEGDRGCIIWNSDECFDWKSANLDISLKGVAMQGPIQEMNSPIAKVFMRAQKVIDPIFIHYSQPSIQVDWLLESIPDGASWVRRFSSFEAENNRMAKVRTAWVKAFQDLGFTPQFISTEQIERGYLRQFTNDAFLAMPMSLAVSEKETMEFREFAKRKNAISSESTPGFFDEHGRLRSREEFKRLSPNANQFSIRNKNAEDYLENRLGKSDPPFLSSVVSQAHLLPAPGIVLAREARARIHRYELGKARLFAIERNINYQISEDLKDAGGNQAFEEPTDVTAYLPKQAHVYDLKRNEYLGFIRGFSFTLDPWRPSMFAILDEKVDNIMATLGAR